MSNEETAKYTFTGETKTEGAHILRRPSWTTRAGWC